MGNFNFKYILRIVIITFKHWLSEINILFYSILFYLYLIFLSSSSLSWTEAFFTSSKKVLNFWFAWSISKLTEQKNTKIIRKTGLSYGMGFIPARGLQRDVVYLGWLIEPSDMSPNAGGRGGVAGSQPMSTAVCRSLNKLWRSNHIYYL